MRFTGRVGALFGGPVGSDPRGGSFASGRKAEYHQFNMTICLSRRRWLGWGLLLWASQALAWESLTFDLPSGAKESFWRDELARRWGGRTEQVVNGGRVDVLTDREAVEVEFPGKWHEGLGQVLHYASETGKQGVLAIVVYARSEGNLLLKTRQRLELIDKQCRENGLRLVVLFPNRGEEFAHSSKQTTAEPCHWLNLETGIRHNEDCPHYGKSKAGRSCGPGEGRACSHCGG